MASDLPEAAHAGAYAMAKVLVTYMDCPERVLRAVKGEFRHPPTIRTIEKMRAAYLASLEPVEDEPCRLEETYYPTDAANDLEKANKEFLWRLDQERLASQRRREAA